MEFRMKGLLAWLSAGCAFAGFPASVSAAEGSGGPADSAFVGAPARPDAARAGDPAHGNANDTLEMRGKAVHGRSTRAHREKELSRVRLDREDLKDIAAAQNDPMRALAALPGTSNQNDLSVRPFVRGGKPEETQVMWEGIPLLQPYHFGSLYSVFNIESLADLTLYSGGFPVQAGNALSGALFMRARPAPLDTASLSADISLLRGNAYAGVPLWKGKLGVSLAYQAFWYDWVFNRGLDLAGMASDNERFKRDKKQIRTYMDLPNFKDLQLGLGWKVSDKLRGEYTGILSADNFSVKEPGTHRFVNGDEVSPDYYAWDLFYRRDLDRREARREVDTLAVASVDNDVHALAFHWRPSERWRVDQTVAYQRQEWIVGFYDEAVWIDSIAPDERFAGHRIAAPSDFRLGIRNRTYDYRLDATAYLGDRLILKMGGSQSLRQSEYGTRLPRPIFETVVNGNVDALDAMGYFNPDGMLIRKDDPGSDPRADYLRSLPNLIRFDQQGDLSGLFPAAYVSGEYDFDAAHRLVLGLRAETDSYANKPFLSPRASYFQGVGKRDELAFAAGLYSQADFPFQIRGVNRSLEPEKAFHFNAEWTHLFSPGYRLECDLYQKNYFDLVVPFLVNAGHLDWGSDLLHDMDSAAYAALPKAQRDSFVARYGDRTMGYRNGGAGKAGGAEISFFYDPSRSWGGWFTAEFGYSKRQDAPDERVYDYRYERPWAFNWVNHFQLPNRFTMALRARYAAGTPYTDYVAYGSAGDDIGSGFTTRSADPENDTLFYAGPRNGKRYSAYSRWDLRLARDFSAGRHPMEAYFELWNAFNTPNFLMTDAQTRQWKFVDLNYPIPILFLGISGRW
jgi:hypothetical protein